MTYKQILAMPDSKEKLSKLELKLLALQHHGSDFYRGLEEYHRLFNMFRR